MRALRIQNLRCLKDTGYLELKPLTILVGRNSSGKSSFLRFLPLLRQSMEARTRGPIRWNGELVDFGSFGEAVHRNGDDPRLGFGYQTSEGFLFEVRLKNDLHSETTYIEGLDIVWDDYRINHVFDKDKKLVRLSVNGVEFTKEILGQGTNLIDYLPLGKEPDSINLLEFTDLHKMFSEVIGPFVEKAEDSKGFNFGEWWYNKFPLEKLTKKPDDETLKHITNVWIAAIMLGHIYGWVKGGLSVMRVHYIQPTRAHALRSYPWDELVVESVDPSGSNLAMVLSSFERPEVFSRWTLENFGFEVFTKRHGPNVSVYLQEKGSENAHNLADTGFGYSQILPLITQLFMILHPAEPPEGPVFFLMEQPELHLHPQLQALLVDAMVVTLNTAKKKKIDLRLIMETHGQTIPNRVGQHIALSKDLTVEDAIVHLFEKEDEKPTSSVRSARFDEKGMLKDWPVGFFAPDLLD